MNSKKINNVPCFIKETNIGKKIIRNMLGTLRNIELKNNKIDIINIL